MADPLLLEEEILRIGKLQFCRSGGPGGQNVNKVNSKVQLKIPLGELGLFTEEEMGRIREKLANRITEDDELLVQCEETRDQLKNRQRAQKKAGELLIQAVKKPKRRKRTKPTKASREKRLEKKQQRKQVKESRKKVHMD